MCNCAWINRQILSVPPVVPYNGRKNIFFLLILQKPVYIFRSDPDLLQSSIANFTRSFLQRFTLSECFLLSFGQPPPTRRAVDPYQLDMYGRRAFAFAWSFGLELAGQRSARSRPQHRQLRSPVEDSNASVSAVLGALNALG